MTIQKAATKNAAFDVFGVGPLETTLSSQTSESNMPLLHRHKNIIPACRKQPERNWSVQSGAAFQSEGFKDKNWGSSPGLLGQ